MMNPTEQHSLANSCTIEQTKVALLENLNLLLREITLANESNHLTAHNPLYTLHFPGQLPPKFLSQPQAYPILPQFHPLSTDTGLKNEDTATTEYRLDEEHGTS